MVDADFSYDVGPLMLLIVTAEKTFDSHWVCHAQAFALSVSKQNCFISLKILFRQSATLPLKNNSMTRPVLMTLPSIPVQSQEKGGLENHVI